jgi:hypothetical protein
MLGGKRNVPLPTIFLAKFSKKTSWSQKINQTQYIKLNVFSTAW